MTTQRILQVVGFTILSIGLVVPHTSQAQDSNLGNWLIYIGNKQLNAKWNLHHEVQLRNYNAIGDLEQLLLRTGLGYSFDDNRKNMLLGYGFIQSENYSDDNTYKLPTSEHRIFQQYISKQSIGKISLQHRFRFEQRFAGSDFKLRLRYFTGATVPISNGNNNKFYLSAYNEIFLNSEKEFFDRNRLYGGIGYNYSKTIRFELGYMNQFFETSSRDQINIISFVSF